MKTTIYCKHAGNRIHNFYLVMNGEEFYLFSQAYRKGVAEYFGKGVFLDEATNFSKAHNDSAVIRTMNKIPMYVKYLEKECEIEVLEQTKKKNNARRSRGCERELVA